MKIILNYSDIKNLVKNAYNLDDTVVIELDGITFTQTSDVLKVLNTMKEFTYPHGSSWIIRPDVKISAIKKLRELIPGCGLLASKTTIENFPQFIEELKKNNCYPVEAYGKLIWKNP